MLLPSNLCKMLILRFCLLQQTVRPLCSCRSTLAHEWLTLLLSTLGYRQHKAAWAMLKTLRCWQKKGPRWRTYVSPPYAGAASVKTIDFTTLWMFSKKMQIDKRLHLWCHAHIALKQTILPDIPLLCKLFNVAALWMTLALYPSIKHCLPSAPHTTANTKRSRS